MASPEVETEVSPFARPLRDIAEQICATYMFDGASLMRLGAVNKFWHSVVSDSFVWEQINAARFGEELLPPPAKPASALPGWSFFPGLDSPENDCASPEDAGADRSPAALARLADARGGVAFNTGGWVKRWVVPSCNWNRWTYEPGAGLWVRSSEIERLQQQLQERRSRSPTIRGWQPPAELPEQAQPPQVRPPDFPGWVFYPQLESPGNDISPPRGGDSFIRMCATLQELAARATSITQAVAFNTTGYIKSDVHSQSNWRRCTGPGGSSWAGLYVREEVVAARRLLRPLPGGGLDPRLRFFQRAKTRLLVARDVGVVWLNGEYLDRTPDPDLNGRAAGACGSERLVVVRLRNVCWLQLDGSFYGLGPGRYRAIWSLRACSTGGYAPPMPTVNFTITLTAKRPHRPLEVFRSPAAAEGQEGAGSAPSAGATGQQQEQGQQAGHRDGADATKAEAGPRVGSELSASTDVRLRVTAGAWRDVAAGEFEVPPGAIYDVGVRLWNYDSNWKSGLFFKELRLVRLQADGRVEEVEEAAAGAGEAGVIGASGARGPPARTAVGAASNTGWGSCGVM